MIRTVNIFFDAVYVFLRQNSIRLTAVAFEIKGRLPIQKITSTSVDTTFIIICLLKNCWDTFFKTYFDY